jgi:hypothetical protein
MGERTETADDRARTGATGMTSISTLPPPTSNSGARQLDRAEALES